MTVKWKQFFKNRIDLSFDPFFYSATADKPPQRAQAHRRFQKGKTEKLEKNAIWLKIEFKRIRKHPAHESMSETFDRSILSMAIYGILPQSASQ